jgi:hypothetical protein
VWSAKICCSLAQPQQPGALEVLDGFLWNAALILAALGAFLQHRHQRSRARHQLVRCRMPSEQYDVRVSRIHEFVSCPRRSYQSHVAAAMVAR